MKVTSLCTTAQFEQCEVRNRDHDTAMFSMDAPLRFWRAGCLNSGRQGAQMKRTGIRKLAIKRETVRWLAASDLWQVAGGRQTCCTYGNSGCQGGPETDHCPPTIQTLKCDSNCCE